MSKKSPFWEFLDLGNFETRVELSQFAQQFTPVFVFCLDTTENDWNLVLNNSWFGTSWGSWR